MSKTYIITVTDGNETIACLICTLREQTSTRFLNVSFTKNDVPGTKSFPLKGVLSIKKIPIKRTNIEAIRKFLQRVLPKTSKVRVALMPQQKRKTVATIPFKRLVKRDNDSFLKSALKIAPFQKPPLHDHGTTIAFDNSSMTFANEPLSHVEPRPSRTNGRNTNIHEDTKKRSSSIQFEVMYVTTRDRIPDPNRPNSFYGKKRGNKMEYGTCIVSIPENREPGVLNRPGWLENIILGENRRKHFVVLSVNPAGKRRFRKSLEEKFDAYHRNDVLIFIHGFNTTFAESIRRAAQLGYDLNFQGPVIAFSWPSIGTTKGYGADIDSAADAGRLLKDFLVDINANTRCENVHIIAHSMGNVTLTEGLMGLKDSQLYPLSKIKQVILAAPDLDQTRFVESIHPKLYHSSTPPRFTLYASSQDKALRMAQKIRAGYPRVGLAGDELLVLDGIESIDASLVDTSEFLEHSYFAGALTIIYDIRDVLRGVQPKDRVLDEKIKTVNGLKKRYWSLRRAGI